MPLLATTRRFVGVGGIRPSRAFKEAMESDPMAKARPSHKSPKKGVRIMAKDGVKNINAFGWGKETSAVLKQMRASTTKFYLILKDVNGNEVAIEIDKSDVELRSDSTTGKKTANYVQIPVVALDMEAPGEAPVELLGEGTATMRIEHTPKPETKKPKRAVPPQDYVDPGWVRTGWVRDYVCARNVEDVDVEFDPIRDRVTVRTATDGVVEVVSMEEWRRRVERAKA